MNCRLHSTWFHKALAEEVCSILRTVLEENMSYFKGVLWRSGSSYVQYLLDLSSKTEGIKIVLVNIVRERSSLTFGCYRHERDQFATSTATQQCNGCNPKQFRLELLCFKYSENMKGLPLQGRLWSFFHWGCVKTNQIDKAVG